MRDALLGRLLLPFAHLKILDELIAGLIQGRERLALLQLVARKLVQAVLRFFQVVVLLQLLTAFAGHLLFEARGRWPVEQKLRRITTFLRGGHRQGGRHGLVERQGELAVLVVEVLLLTQLVHHVVALPVQGRDVRENGHVVHVEVIRVHMVREVVLEVHLTNCVEVLSARAEVLSAHRQPRVV